VCLKTLTGSSTVTKKPGRCKIIFTEVCVNFYYTSKCKRGFIAVKEKENFTQQCKFSGGDRVLFFVG